MANVGPHVWYCRDNAPTSTLGWSAITAWATGATIAAGVIRRQLATPAIGSERAFVCIIAGTTHATTEPTWVTAKGNKTTDNTVTWMECTGQPAVNGDLTNCPTWLQNKNTAVSLGHIIQNGAGTILLICTTAGTTSNSTEPSWSTTPGTINSDGATVKWTTISSSYSAYAAPHARLNNALQTAWAANGDTVFVGDDHTETQAATLSFSSGTPANPTFVYCVDHTVVPPGSGNLRTTASLTTTGAFGIGIGGGSTTGIYLNGLILNAGTGANAVNITISGGGNNPALTILENCTLAMVATSSSPYIIGANAKVNKIRWINTTVSFGNIADLMNITCTDFLWKNTPSAIVGTPPTNLIQAQGQSPGNFVFDGVDLSAMTGTIFSHINANGGKNLFIDCKLNASVTPALITQPGVTADFVRCSSAATDYDIKSYRYEGTLLSDAVVIRTGGASDGTTSVSYNLTTAANSTWINPFEALPITIWNPTTAANVTVTIYGIANMATLPNNDQVWFDVEYQGSASSPIASFATGSKANTLASGSPLTADTSAWDSQVTVRSNGETVAVGATRKTTDSPGRVWFCTAITTGVLAGSEPGGMGSAADGAVVTDGGATWRAGYRFRQAVVLTSPQPQIAGYVRIVPKIAIASTTVYVDPKPVLS